MIAFQDLTWFGYAVIVWWTVNALTYYALVGRGIKYTLAHARVAFVVYFIMNLLVLTVGTNH